MKSKVNAALAIIAGVVITTAYACDLDRVVVCKIQGDSLGTFTGSWAGTTFSSTAYATENAYRVDVYSVTKGGFSDAASDTTSCAGNSRAAGPNPDRIANEGFMIDYYVPPLGVSEDDHNPSDNGFFSPGGHYFYTTGRTITSQTGGGCN